MGTSFLCLFILGAFIQSTCAGFQFRQRYTQLSIRHVETTVNDFRGFNGKFPVVKHTSPTKSQSTALLAKGDGSSDIWQKVAESPKRSLLFSLLMSLCGALLGPFLDSYHSAFGVLKYDEPITATLWGNEQFPALTTAWWVPELFGLAGFLIGWIYIIFDAILSTDRSKTEPSPPKILIGISIFTLQYWLSGILYEVGVDRSVILNVMSLIASIGFLVFDGTMAGFIASTATMVGGPLIEVGLLWASSHGYLTGGGYHYNDIGETGFFSLWILPVYFLGGPANGNLARGFWNILGERKETAESRIPCQVCNGTRRDTCPNCDGVGTYVAMGGESVTCTSCLGRGYVICRQCFGDYDENPYDIDAIRDKMSRMPD